MLILPSLTDAIIFVVIFVLGFINYICNGKFDEVLFKENVTKGVVTPYNL